MHNLSPSFASIPSQEVVLFTILRTSLIYNGQFSHACYAVNFLKKLDVPELRKGSAAKGGKEETEKERKKRERERGRGIFSEKQEDFSRQDFIIPA